MPLPDSFSAVDTTQITDENIKDAIELARLADSGVSSAIAAGLLDLFEQDPDRVHIGYQYGYENALGLLVSDASYGREFGDPVRDQLIGFLSEDMGYYREPDTQQDFSRDFRDLFITISSPDSPQNVVTISAPSLGLESVRLLAPIMEHFTGNIGGGEELVLSGEQINRAAELLDKNNPLLDPDVISRPAARWLRGKKENEDIIHDQLQERIAGIRDAASGQLDPAHTTAVGSPAVAAGAAKGS